MRGQPMRGVQPVGAGDAAPDNAVGKAEQGEQRDADRRHADQPQQRDAPLAQVQAHAVQHVRHRGEAAAAAGRTITNSSRAIGNTARRGMARLRNMCTASSESERSSAAPRIRWAKSPIGQRATARAVTAAAMAWRRIGRRCPASASPKARNRRRRRGEANRATALATRWMATASASATSGWTTAGPPGNRDRRSGRPGVIRAPPGSGQGRRPDPPSGRRCPPARSGGGRPAPPPARRWPCGIGPDRREAQGFRSRPSYNRCRNGQRSEEHTSELQSLMRRSYAVFCLKKKKKNEKNHNYRPHIMVQKQTVDKLNILLTHTPPKVIVRYHI